jgi:hypothetical protein
MDPGCFPRLCNTGESIENRRSGLRCGGITIRLLSEGRRYRVVLRTNSHFRLMERAGDTAAVWALSVNRPVLKRMMRGEAMALMESDQRCSPRGARRRRTWPGVARKRIAAYPGFRAQQDRSTGRATLPRLQLRSRLWGSRCQGLRRRPGWSRRACPRVWPMTEPGIGRWPPGRAMTNDEITQMRLWSPLW